ncbi:hypothetical protein PTKIN_Ptkin12aG0117500 [Pterospermum kingtungense]
MNNHPQDNEEAPSSFSDLSRQVTASATTITGTVVVVDRVHQNTPFSPEKNEPGTVKKASDRPTFDLEPITIGEALETTAISVADKPVDSNDAAAIQAAERRATGGVEDRRCGRLGATAQAAASFNARAAQDVTKITIFDVLSDAASKLSQDKAVTSEDAEEVRGAELRSRPEAFAMPGGVADTMAKAARVNIQDDTA